MHIVSAIVWGKRTSEEQYDTLLAYSLDVVNDHHDFTEIIPSWYRQKADMFFSCHLLTHFDGNLHMP